MADLIRAVIQAFNGQVVHRRISLAYRLALVWSAGGLCILIVGYFASVVGVGYGLFLFAVYALPTVQVLRGGFVPVYIILAYVGVLLGGLAVLYSLLAPLFRWRRESRYPRLLPAGAHPVLHCFVQALCTLLNAPQPAEIHLDPTPNAWAGRRGGFLGLGSRLVLGIGGPLLLGMDLRSLAGVISHELGHFTQSGSRSLLGFIYPVARWFDEAAARTSGFNKSIADQSGGREKWYIFFIQGSLELHGESLMVECWS